MKEKSKKKLWALTVLMSIAVFSGTLFACVNENFISAKDIPPINENNENLGSAVITVFIPDYDSFSLNQKTCRLVAPQTESVRLGYNTEEGFEYLEAVNLSHCLKSEKIESDLNLGLIGYSYTLEFVGIPCRIYSENELEIQLLDANSKIISKGTNSEIVEVNAENIVNVNFFTIPVCSDDKSGSLEIGEMKFLKMSALKDCEYEIFVSAGNSSVYPDIVLFAADGSFVKYIDILPEKTSFVIEAAEYNAKYFIGIWAKDGEIPFYDIDISKKNKKPEEQTSEPVSEKTGKICAVIDGIDNGGKNFFCLNCGTHYDSEEKRKLCGKEDLCPMFAKLDALSSGSYDLSVGGGYSIQSANERMQIVDNIAVSARIDEDCVVLRLESKVQQGTIKFVVSKPMEIFVTEILGTGQVSLYGVSIVSCDGTATCEGEIVSVLSLPTTKSGSIDISNKTLELSPGLYELAACQSGKNTKVTNITLTEISE